MTVFHALQSALIWYVAVSALAVLSLPITFYVCGGLTDRGLSIYRPLGIAVVALPVWWFGNLLSVPFTTTTFLISTLVVGTAAWAYGISRGQILAFLHERWRRALTLEIATAVLFFGYVLMRGFNPDARGTEKPMEMAFLNAAILTDHLPAPDPWFAGEPINYYYFGYAVLGLLAKVTGTSGGVAFHMGLATTFALAIVAAAGLASNLADRIAGRPRIAPIVAGLLSGFLVMFSGNLNAAIEFVRSPSETMRQDWWQGVGWGSSRVIEDRGFADGSTRDVITEFPAFSWILGDLHPHVLAYPWLIVALALVFNLYICIRSSDRFRAAIAPAAGVGLSLAVLYSANTWDVPIVALVTALTLISGLPSHGARRVLGLAGVIGASGVFVALPFALNYTPAAGDPNVESGIISRIPLVGDALSTVGFVDWDRTSSWELMVAHGGFLLLSLIVFAGMLAHRIPETRRLQWPGVAGLAVAMTILAILVRVPALAIIGIPLLLTLWVMMANDVDAGRRAALGLMAVAFLAIVATEFVFIRDPFGDRMNTVFKVYFQVWTLLAIATSALIPIAFRRIRDEFQGVGAAITTVTISAVLISVSVYAPISAYRWFNEFDSWRGIDGLAYLEQTQPAEAAAIHWLSERADSSTVILEAPGCAYGSDHGVPHNRYSMATGIPTVIGWPGHEFQWRRQQPELFAEIPQRIDHARVIYETPGSPEAAEYLERHAVTYIVVGVHETVGYGHCEHGPPYSMDGRSALDALDWNREYDAGGVTIYARPDRVPAN